MRSARRFDALLDEPAFARAVLDAAPVIVLVLDAEGRVVHYNPFMEQLCGVPVAEVRGCDWFETFIPSDERSDLSELFARSIDGEVVHANVNFVEVRDGPPRLIEWYDRKVEPRESGEVYVIAIGVDITERVRAATEQEDLARRFELIADGVDEGFFLTNATRERVLYMNKAFERISGVAREDIYADARRLAGVLHPEDRLSFARSLGSTIAPGERTEREYRLLRPRPEGGEPELRWLWVRYGGVEGIGEEGPQIAGTVTDITEYKRATLEREELGRLFELFDAAIDEVFVLISPTRDRVIYVSDSIERLYGIEREALYRDSAVQLEAVHPEDRARVGQMIGRPIAEGEVEATEFRVCRSDGSERWIMSRARTLGEDSAMPGAIVAISIDITARRQVEARLRRLTSELEARVEDRTASLATEREHLRRVLDSMAAFVVLLDVDGRIVLVNRLVRDVFGVDEAVLPAWAASVMPRVEVASTCHVHGTDAFARARAGTRSRFDLELTLVDGLELVVDVSLEPVCDEGGQVVEIVASGVDVTAARANERRLRDSLESLAVKEARLGDAQRIADVGDWDWDIVNDRISWSAQTCRIVGVEPGSMAPSYVEFLALVHEDDREAVDAGVRRALDEDEPYLVEHRLVRPNGECRYVLEQAELSRDEGGQPFRMQGTVQDITRQKQVEARLRASIAEKDALLHEIHHRVKNNLQVVVSLLYLQGLGLDEHTRAALDESRNRIRSMVLIHEQLYLSGELSRIDVREFIAKLAAELGRVYTEVCAPRIRVFGQDLVLGIEQAVPVALIINELLTNALKYAYPHPRKGAETRPEIRVEIGADRLVVEDDGVGWPVDFELEGDSSLGLRLVRILSRQLDARVEFERRSSGGARVYLRLPVSSNS